MKKKILFTAILCMLICSVVSLLPVPGLAKSKKVNRKKVELNLNKERVSFKVGLPKGWRVSKDVGKDKALRLGTSTRSIYDKDGKYVGYCGIETYTDGLKRYQDAENVQQLYAEVDLGNDYQFNVHSDVSDIKFKNLIKTKDKRTDICGVYYSATMTDDHKEKTNYGILSCHNKGQAYLIFDIERSAATMKQVKKIAKSITFVK